MYLYHYFEKSRGPFLTLSDLSKENAAKILNDLKNENSNLVPPDIEWFLNRRYELEKIVYKKFIKKGGKPIRKCPHHLTVEKCEYLKTWYLEPCYVKIHISEFDFNTVSFTYGDMFPVFNPRLDNGEEYRNKVYNYKEIIDLIEKYGLPQLSDRQYEFDAECYIEACVWSDSPINNYRENWLSKNK